MQNALASIHAPIGVFVTKTHGTIDVKNLSFYFLGRDYENLAWEQILKMSPETKIQIFTSVEAAPHISADYDGERYPNISVLADGMSPLPSLFPHLPLPLSLLLRRHRGLCRREVLQHHHLGWQSDSSLSISFSSLIRSSFFTCLLHSYN